MEVAAVIIGFGLAGLFVLTFRGKKFPRSKKRAIENLIEHVQNIKDPATSVLEADKVLHETFKAAGGKGSMGECLRSMGERLPNEQSVWSAHKLRNRIAHEPQVTVTPKQSKTAVKELLRAARSLL